MKTRKRPAWLLEYEDGGTDVLEFKPDFSSDTLPNVPVVTPGVTVFIPRGKTYIPQTADGNMDSSWHLRRTAPRKGKGGRK